MCKRLAQKHQPNKTTNDVYNLQLQVLIVNTYFVNSALQLSPVLDPRPRPALQNYLDFLVKLL